MRVAGIDCGTNSIRLLVADVEPDGTLVDVTRQMRIVRLGQDVDRTGRLAPEAIERTRVALVDYVATIRRSGAARVRMVATSATRDAANTADFVTMVRATLGADPDVIGGEEEAGLSFTGALAGLPGIQAPVLVADVGGGSSELVVGSPGGPLHSRSLDVGCVRLTERHLHDDPPTAAQCVRVSADVRLSLQRAQRDLPLRQARTFVGVAGTVTTIAALVLDLPRYDPAAIQGAVLPAGRVHGMTAWLACLTHDERAALPVMHPGRVDVIVAGALIVSTMLTAFGDPDLVTSEHDILDGIVMSLTSPR